jgi:hypothetical protein
LSLLQVILHHVRFIEVLLLSSEFGNVLFLTVTNVQVRSLLRPTGKYPRNRYKPSLQQKKDKYKASKFNMWHGYSGESTSLASAISLWWFNPNNPSISSWHFTKVCLHSQVTFHNIFHFYTQISGGSSSRIGVRVNQILLLNTSFYTLGDCQYNHVSLVVCNYGAIVETIADFMLHLNGQLFFQFWSSAHIVL